ncbi:hypothetical protein Tsubulata_027801 [Turnera subulata]|uniref:PUM-HD domain-containing protein n=1 Tax=Turnera subulata TaxID=218843 RepID=A0A9Q0GC97_9ROSI|nr:hypothetical protein Tsubulata_027801 [Turnera subulata]
MATGSNIGMLPTLDDGLQGPNGTLDDSLQNELELILQAQRNRRIIDHRERDLNVCRSGSAPPTVEGSLSAVGSLFRNYNFGDADGVSDSGSSNLELTEDEMRLHPAYLSYYYSNENINPRLPPPLLSKEDWRVAQRFRARGPSFGGVGDLRKKKLVDKSDSSSLFSVQPGLSVQQAEADLNDLRNAYRNNLSRNASVEWLDRGLDGFTGLQASRLGARRKSFADILQEGIDRPTSVSGRLSSPASHNALGDMVDTGRISSVHSAGLCNGAQTAEGLLNGAGPPGFGGVPSRNSTTVPHSFASVLGSSLSRSTTPEQQLVGRPSSFGLPPVASRVGPIERTNATGITVQNSHSSGATELGEIAATLSGLSLSKPRHADQETQLQGQLQLDLTNDPNVRFNTSNGHNRSRQNQFIDKSTAENLAFSSNYIDVARKNGLASNLSASRISSNRDGTIPRRTSSSANLLSKVNSSALGRLERLDVQRKNVGVPSTDFAGNVLGDYSINQKLNSMINDHLDAASELNCSGNVHDFYGLGNQAGPDLQSAFTDPRYAQYLQRTSTHASANPNGPHVRKYLGTSDGQLGGIQDGIQKACLETLLAQQKQQYELPVLGKYGSLNQGYYQNSSYSLGMPYPENLMTNSILPSVGSGSSQSERLGPFASMMKSSVGGPTESWHFDIGSTAEKRYASTLLDEFKSSKTRSFELSDIVGHVVEFSMDQYGSRFIQQKLETASVEEKNKIFPELLPHARTLMTDVFGNYVIQKFFDHGSEEQRMELASQLTGHVLPLSLQMYGCRVIQKALEVINVEQRTELVGELDGSVMKCIRDQNGNHVIQKCIECVPEDRIQFIISAFYGQVVALSTHPYGCRVIQRVLEHCADRNTQQIIMDEVMQSVCTLAQDQYGNYVIQHVLEHGKPQERSAIISKLAGQIVIMSQQKFASNVVEKCLTFGGPEERQLLVKEMLGSTDENEPLQAMMKDPFGNYVVQKVLETCDDESLELILSRIKVHLSALKRYTYGKHIVSRVEKLILTGERRIGLSSSISS